jgi:hypothetical protein
VIEIPFRIEPDRLELDLLVLRVVSVRRRVGSGKSIEKIVQAAVLLNDDNDVANLRARRVAPDGIDEDASTLLRRGEDTASARGQKWHDEGADVPTSQPRATSHREKDGSFSDA